MKIISILTQKGGVGKTTTTIHLAGYLAEKKFKVLVIDFDNQCNLTYGYALEESQTQDVLDFIENPNIKNFATKGNKNRISIVKGNLLLSASKLNQYSLSNSINKIKNEFDFVLIDCPPAGINNEISLGEIALCSSDYIISPIEADIHAINGIFNLIDGINMVKQKWNNNLQFLGLFFNKVLVNSRDFKEYHSHLVESLASTNFLFKNFVRQDVNVSNAKKLGITIFELNNKSRASNDFRSLGNEILKRI